MSRIILIAITIAATAAAVIGIMEYAHYRATPVAGAPTPATPEIADLGPAVEVLKTDLGKVATDVATLSGEVKELATAQKAEQADRVADQNALGRWAGKRLEALETAVKGAQAGTEVVRELAVAARTDLDTLEASHDQLEAQVILNRAESKTDDSYLQGQINRLKEEADDPVVDVPEAEEPAIIPPPPEEPELPGEEVVTIDDIILACEGKLDDILEDYPTYGSTLEEIYANLPNSEKIFIRDACRDYPDGFEIDPPETEVVDVAEPPPARPVVVRPLSPDEMDVFRRADARWRR